GAEAGALGLAQAVPVRAEGAAGQLRVVEQGVEVLAELSVAALAGRAAQQAVDLSVPGLEEALGGVGVGLRAGARRRHQAGGAEAEAEDRQEREEARGGAVHGGSFGCAPRRRGEGPT